MAFGIIIRADELRSLGFASVGASYTAIGSALEHPGRIISIKNLTNGTVLFSFDGSTDHEILPANGALVLDFTTNKATDSGLFMAQETVVYAKQGPAGAPSSGSVYVSVYYGKGD